MGPALGVAQESGGATRHRYWRLDFELQSALERQFKDGKEVEALSQVTTRVRTGHLNSSYVSKTERSDLVSLDAVKQRMQLSVGSYRNVVDCVQKVRAREGLSSLYAGYGTTLVMNVPFNAVFFLAYETSKELAIRRFDVASDSIQMHLACGAIGEATVFFSCCC